MTPRLRVGVLLLALPTALAAGAIEPQLLAMAPALLLLALIWCGRYPGERLIGLLAARTARPRRAPASAGARRYTPRLMARGGALLACALAGRGPPIVPALRCHRAGR